MQVVSVGALDLDGSDFADTQRAAACDMNRTVDLRRVTLAAALGQARFAIDCIDDHALAVADLALEPLFGNVLLARHETMPALLFHLGRHQRGEIIGERAVDRLIAEAADTIELGLGQPVEELSKVVLGLAGKPDDEGRADGQIRADVSPSPDALERLFLRGGPA